MWTSSKTLNFKFIVQFAFQSTQLLTYHLNGLSIVIHNCNSIYQLLNLMSCINLHFIRKYINSLCKTSGLKIDFDIEVSIQ